MYIHNLLNMDNLNKMISEGFISVRKHSILPYSIYNYTHAASYDNMWNQETLICRGLIVDNTSGKIISRPMPKFFNWEQDEPKGKIPVGENFEAFTKMDGSLGIMYFAYDMEFAVATRGSFDSDQAIEATKILREKYGSWLKDRYEMFEGKTVLFEIIYPENRIVVDYNGMRDVVMLTIIDNETGKDSILDIQYPWPVVKRYDGIKDLKKIKELNSDNEEGFVILFESGYRCKVKFDEYMRLHRVLTGVNDKDIWESLSLGNDPEKEYAEKVPDEFYSWMKETKKKLIERFNDIQWELEKKKMDLMSQNFNSRKDVALWIQANVESEYRGMVFNYLDRKDYKNQIWKMIKPVGPFTSFKVDEE